MLSIELKAPKGRKMVFRAFSTPFVCAQYKRGFHPRLCSLQPFRLLSGQAENSLTKLAIMSDYSLTKLAIMGYYSHTKLAFIDGKSKIMSKIF